MQIQCLVGRSESYLHGDSHTNPEEKWCHLLQCIRYFCAGIFEQSIGARNRVGIGLSYTAPPGYIGCRNRFRGIDSELHESLKKCRLCAGIFEQFVVARNRVGIGLSYRPTRLHRLPESIPWNRFRGVDSWAPWKFKIPALYWNFKTINGGYRNRVGIWLSYRPARLHRLAESIPWNQFLRGSLKV